MLVSVECRASLCQNKYATEKCVKYRKNTDRLNLSTTEIIILISLPSLQRRSFFLSTYPLNNTDHYFFFIPSQQHRSLFLSPYPLFNTDQYFFYIKFPKLLYVTYHFIRHIKLVHNTDQHFYLIIDSFKKKSKL